jgi:hypothetical protein
MAAPIGNHLSLEIFPFVVGFTTQAIKKGESLTGVRD